MAPLIGETAPNFAADSTKGEITLHDYIKDSWAILFSHPADFTPVCTTELARVSQLLPEFEKRNVKCLALSCDDAASHKAWVPDICAYAKSTSTDIGYPILADADRSIARAYGMLPAAEGDGMPMTVRSVFVIGTDGKVKLSLTYPASTGRNFDEILRVIDSLQLAVSAKVATPVDWKKGDECVVLPSVKDEQAAELFPKGFKPLELPSGKPYLRMTPMPDA
ncbi:unnamed protein product [Agarophyton chilense]